MKNTKITNVSTQDKVRKSNKWLWSLAAVFVGLFIGWIILMSTGENPADYYGAVIAGNFGSTIAFTNFLGTMSWMILIGLSMVVSFRAKIFNIGSVGQMIAGGMAGYMFAAFVDIGRFGVVFSILIPMFVGMGVAWLIGYLKVRFNVHEVISSIMINWSIYYLYKFFTNSNQNPWMFTGTQTNPILESNSLRMPWMDAAVPGTTLNIMFFVAIILAVVFMVMYAKTRWGVKQDILGKGKDAATYAGINRNREIVKTMMISGALAGLAGSAFYLGVNQNLPTIGGDIPAEGFNGITIALIGFNGPLGILVSSAFVGMMYNARALVSTTTNPYISDLILGIIVLTVSITNYFIIYRPQDKFFAWMDGKRDTLFTSKQHVKTEENIIKELNEQEKLKVENINVNDLASQEVKKTKSSSQKGGKK